MYEKLKTKVPDTDKYLERIGLERPKAFDEDTLDEIIFAHQCRIVFENLDPMKRKAPSLETEDLFEKIINQGRGGYCFELNGLFVKFLETLGFDAYSCRCRIVRSKDFTPAIMHRGNIVKINEDLFYCDVGFGGPQPGFCVKIEDGFVKEKGGECFGMKKADNYWWTLTKKGPTGEFSNIIQFTLMPEEPADFIPFNYYCSTNLQSGFTQRYFLNRRLKDGSISLTGTVYAKTKGGIRTEETVTDIARLMEIAAADFGLPKEAF